MALVESVSERFPGHSRAVIIGNNFTTGKLYGSEFIGDRNLVCAWFEISTSDAPLYCN